MSTGLSRLKAFDLYRKPYQEYVSSPTFVGSVISVLCAATMLFLFASEFVLFLQYDTQSEMIVEQDHGEQLHINFNFTFPALPCFALSLDVLDTLGRHDVNVVHDIVRQRTHSPALGTGAEPLPLFTDAQVGDEELLRTMASNQEGCNLAGFVAVNKVPGNFHISAHGAHHLANRLLGGRVPVNHIIHSLWAGETAPPPGAGRITAGTTPGILRPLDGTDRSGDDGATTYEYFLDIVPTKYNPARGQPWRAYQMTAHAHRFNAAQFGHMPAVYFRYELSPIHVVYTTARKPLAHFLTSVCAIVGGVFTVAGLLNSMIQSSVLAFQKNILGKSA